MTRTPSPERVLFGASYYHEYQPSPRLDIDLDLMAEAGFTAIRVGESVWSTWEPEDGRYDLEWLAPVLDGAHRRGIRVIVGTPTYAVPPWLARRYPEIAGETETGKRQPWGGRQEIDYTHPAFKFHAERTIRRIVARYADHPAGIGFQVDNEPGLMMFHNHGVFQRFLDELRHTYGSVEALNEAWGLVYWSHKLSTWADLWTPDGNFQPQYDLAWRRFQARLTTEFITWQADIVREYLRDDQFVMTDLAFDRATVEEAVITRGLDVTAGNPYYAMQEALAVPDTGSARHGFWTSGAWSLFFSADRMRAAKQAPFLITETNAGAIGGPASNFPAYDGQWRQAAWAFVARGAEMVQYWHWHTNHFGTETYWVGVLPHDQRPGRVYRELSQLGADFRRAGSRVVGLTPDAGIGLLYSTQAKWGLAAQAPLPRADAVGGWAGENLDEQSYHRIVQAFYRGAFDAGIPARILHDVQLVDRDGTRLLDPDEVARHLPILVVAGLLVADDGLLTWLRDYANAGGHLIIGPRTAYGDHEGRARIQVKPALLSEAAGVHYQEFSNLLEPLTVTAPTDEFRLSHDAAATGWVDLLVSDGAKPVLGYEHPHFGRFPAVVTKDHGRGRVTTVGTIPNPSMAADLIAWAAAPGAQDEWGRLPTSVTVHSATSATGERIHVVHNWSWEPVRVRLPRRMDDVLVEDGEPAEELELGAWDVRVVAG
jgi:beta-galactosidase